MESHRFSDNYEERDFGDTGEKIHSYFEQRRKDFISESSKICNELHLLDNRKTDLESKIRETDEVLASVDYGANRILWSEIAGKLNEQKER